MGNSSNNKPPIGSDKGIMRLSERQIQVCHESMMQAVGGQLAMAVAALDITAPFIIYLEGNLGMGKTTLVRGFLRALGYAGHVRSPTYTLLEPYTVQQWPVLHLDLYRLAHPEELLYLGLVDYLAQPVVFLIEWPAQGIGALPQADCIINITLAGQDERLLCLQAGTVVGERLLSSLELC